MKKFTFLFTILFIATIAKAQETHGLQHKIKKMQETMSRFSMQTEQFAKSGFPLTPKVQRNVLLKNALAVQKLDSVVYQEYLAEIEDWNTQAKDEYHYDSELKNNLWIEEEWDNDLGIWKETGKIQIDFTEDGKVNALDIFTPDETTGQLIYLNRSVVYYNPEGRLDSVLHYYYVTDPMMNWLIDGKQIYHYNETGQMERIEITSMEEDEEGVYYLLMAIVNNYNYLGQIATTSMYIIDSEMELLFSETTYIYDDSGRLVANEVSILDFLTSMVDLVSRTDYEYNVTGDVSVETYSNRDQIAEEWNVDQKFEYTYSDLNFTEVIIPTYFNFFGIYEDYVAFNKAPVEIIAYEMTEGTLEFLGKTIFYFSEGTATNVGTLNQVEISIYPNPASDQISFNWNSSYEKLSLEIYQITGSKLLEKSVSPGTVLPISHLSNGMYIFKLLNGQQTIHSGKMIKK